MTTNVSGINSTNSIPKIQNVNFGDGNAVQPSAIVNNPIKDSFVPSNQPAQEGLSSGAKWAIGLGVAAAVGGAVLYAMRGKFNQAVKLAEHIDFKPAKTIEEAAEFAKTHLGVKKFEINNLELANYSNEALTKASNLTKGKIKLPAAITTYSSNDSATGLMHMLPDNGGTISYNLRNYNNIIPKTLEDGISVQTLLNNKNILKKVSPDFANLLEKIAKKEKLSLSDKLLFDEYSKLLSNKNGVIFMEAKSVSPFWNVWHELGHLNHYYNDPALFNSLDALCYYSPTNLPRKVVKHVQEFVDNLNKIKEAVSLSTVALNGPREFVPEVFAGLLTGRKYPQGVMDLYKKYGGPMLG